MKPGDVVAVNHIALPPEVTVLEVNGEWAAVWWPCPEYGRHTKVIHVGKLTPTGKTFRGAAPKRTKDEHRDYEPIVE
jgi:hypothetical protein